MFQHQRLLIDTLHSTTHEAARSLLLGCQGPGRKGRAEFVFYCLGIAHQRLGQNDKAIELYRQQVEFVSLCPCACSSVSITYLGISLFPFPSCFFLRCPVRTTFVLPLALDQSKVWSTSRGGQVFWQSRQHSRSEDGLVSSHSISGANHGYFQGGGRQDVRSKIVQHSFKHIHDFTPAHPDAGFCRHEGSHSGHRSISLEQVQRK